MRNSIGGYLNGHVGSGLMGCIGVLGMGVGTKNERVS
jgi:hypothetical protein